MKSHTKTSLLTMFSVLLLLGSVTAKAATLSLNGGTGGSLPDNWDPFPTAPGLSIGSDITIFTAAAAAAGEGLVLDDNANVVYTYIGKEAGSTNALLTSDVIGNVFVTGSTAPGTTHETTASAGLLEFAFEGLATCCVLPGVIVNGIGSFGPNAGLSLAIAMISPSSAYLMFGDGFGDADYDDMVVRVDVSAIPLPAAVWLFGTALIGLVGFSRRRKVA